MQTRHNFLPGIKMESINFVDINCAEHNYVLGQEDNASAVDPLAIKMELEDELESEPGVYQPSELEHIGLLEPKIEMIVGSTLNGDEEWGEACPDSSTLECNHLNSAVEIATAKCWICFGTCSPSHCRNMKRFVMKLNPENLKKVKAFTEEVSSKNKSVGYCCGLCNTVLSCEKTFLKHSVMHSSQVVLFCGVCKERFESEEELNLHKQWMHSDDSEILLCLECNEGFMGKEALDEHCVEVHKTRFPCGDCEKVFNTDAQWNNHRSYCKGIWKWHKCSYCGKEFRRQSYLQKHLLKHAEAEEQSPEPCSNSQDEFTYCKVCGERFLYSEMNDHITCMSIAIDEADCMKRT